MIYWKSRLEIFRFKLKGKIVGQRVLDMDGPKMESTGSVSGTYKEESVNIILTFISTTDGGVIHGEGLGVMSNGYGEIVTYRGHGIGWLTTSGNIQ